MQADATTNTVPVTRVQTVGAVETVLGPVPADELGVCSMHEHVLCDLSSYRDVADPPYRGRPEIAAPSVTLEHHGALRYDGAQLVADNMQLDDRAHASAELAEFVAAGGRAIVEMSTPGLRTDVAGLAEAARGSGAHVVATTGLYVRGSRPRWLTDLSTAALADWMVAEIEEGIEDTGIRAGHIGEIGITDLADDDRSVLLAAAEAAARTGCSVTVHPGFTPDADGRRIAPILIDAGLAPDRIVIGHADAFLQPTSRAAVIRDPRLLALQLDYHRAMLDLGVVLAIDCLGHDYELGLNDALRERDIHRLAAVAALVDEGHADQLVLGCDVCLKTLTRRFGGRGHRRLLTALEELASAGVAPAALERMTVVNPARLLARPSRSPT